VRDRTGQQQRGSPRTPTPAVGVLQRKCACGTHAGGRATCSACTEKEHTLQREVRNDHEVTEIPPIVDEVLRSPGQPLDSETRAFFEPRFGHDFSHVRVHTDAKAAESAAAVNALAYTVGRDVVFGVGQYAPKTPLGKRLLAHELTHVLQQRGQPLLSNSVSIGDSGTLLEMEAEALSGAVVDGRTSEPSQSAAAVSISPAIVQRLRAPLTPAQAEAARELASKTASRLARRAGWRQFWRVIVRRFALRGAVAASLAAADGPLPVGDLIGLGLTIWMVWEIIQLWDTLWREAETQSAGERQPEAEQPPQAESEQDIATRERRRRRADCMRRNGAPFCEEPLQTGDEIRDEILVQFLLRQTHRDFTPNDLGDCYQVGSQIERCTITDCGLAPAISYHCRVNRYPEEISIFACLCCDENGDPRFQWSEPHWSPGGANGPGR